MAPTAEFPARYRKSRTRSRTTNPAPPLAVSTLRPHQYDLRPACASLRCPACKTWVPITGVQAKVQKLVPHDTGRARQDSAVRCRNSNRLVSIDVPFEVWWERLEDGAAEAGGRRSARQHSKPLPPPAPPLHRVLSEVGAEQARRAYADHVDGCLVCVGETEFCRDGERLAVAFLRVLREQEPGRRQSRPAGRRARADQWARVLPSVQRTDAQRAQLPAGTESPSGGPDLPLQTRQ